MSEKYFPVASIASHNSAEPSVNKPIKKDSIMKKQIYIAVIVVGLAGTLALVTGCNQETAKAKEAQNAAKAAEVKLEAANPRIIEKVEVTAGKPISAEDRSKVSSIALKALDHISKAQQDINAKNVAGAMKDVNQAVSLMAILKEILPSVKVVDSIRVAKTNVSYTDSTDVPQDWVTIMASLNQLYDVLPEGKAKEHAKIAKETVAKAAVAKGNEKVAAKAQAKESLEAVEESIDFSEVDLSVSQVSHWIDLAQEDLNKGETKPASEALTDATEGVMFVDFDIVDPVSMAAREIWLATQDWAGKSPKTTKTRLDKAKTSLEEVAKTGTKTQQEQAQQLIVKLEAIDTNKAGEPTEKALQALWQSAKTLAMGGPVQTK
jgi:hypothetical protein